MVAHSTIRKICRMVIQIKLNKRQKELVALLLDENTYRTVESFAHELFVSERTIHSDLKAINDYLQLKGLSVDKRRGVGVRVINSAYEYKNSNKGTEIIGAEVGERRKEITIRLLFNNERVTFEKLSEEYLVSKSSINNDLRYIEKIITAGNKLQLISDSKGTRFEGDQISFLKGHVEFNNMIFEEDIMFAKSDNTEYLDELKKYYGKDIVDTCSEVLYTYLIDGNKDIPEHYTFNVLGMLIVIVYRIKKGHHIRHEVNEDIHSRFLYIASRLLEKITTALDLKYIEEEATYLHRYLLSNKFYLLDNECSYSIIEDIVDNVRKSLKIHHWNDKKLIELLKKHFSPMIYRLQSGIKIRNPFLDQIKNEFGPLFNITWMILNEYETDLGVTFNEDEVGFLVIYFQSAIEQSHTAKSILIVCSTGIATSELLVNRIRKVIPTSSSIKVSSIRDIEENSLVEADLIISTVNIDHITDKNIIKVSPLLNSLDMKKISAAYNEKFVFQDKSNVDKFELPNLSKFINKKFIIVDRDFKDKKTLIGTVTQSMVDQQRVQEAALENMLKREKLGGTDLPSGAAIPHVNPRYVDETTIVIVKNKSCIKWDEYSVNLIFLIYISEKDTNYVKDIFSDIYQVVESRERVKHFNELIEHKDFIKLIGRDDVK